MLKKLILLGALLTLWFAISFASIASEANATTYKWLKFEVTHPTDFVFDRNVVIELTNEDTKETHVINVRKEEDYIAYQSVSAGAYVISDIRVPGNYEGYFTFGYPESAIKITKESEEMTIVPILLELQYYGDESATANEQNLYEGMTYEEVMAAVEKEEMSDGEQALENLNVSELLTEEEDEYSYEEKTDEPKTLEEKIAEEKVAYDTEANEIQNKQESEDSLKGGAIAMGLALVGIGIAFLVVKKKRDI